MKSFRNVLLFMLLLMPAVGFSQNYGAHIVADGSATNRFVPIYGYYADYSLRSQTIYPASMLTSLQGAVVTHLSFYLQTTASRVWNADFEVRVGVTSATKLNGFDDTTTMQTVFSGPLEGTSPVISFTLDSAFAYTGGNLIVEVRSDGGDTYSDVYFYGVQSDSSSWQGYDGSSVDNIGGSVQHFIPKVDFHALNTSCLAPASISVNRVSSFGAVLSWSPSATAASYLVSCGGRTFGVLDTTCVIDSLAPDSDYQVVLRSLCSNGDTSGEVSCGFHTYCAPVVLSDATSFVEDFESGIGGCWSNFHLEGPGNHLWEVSATMVHAGAASGCLPDQSATTRTMLVSQPIVVPRANEYQLSFWTYKVNYVPPRYQSRTAEGIRVWANTTPDTVGATQLYYYHRNTDLVDVSGFTLCEALIPRADTLFIIFEGISQYSGALYIDDVEISRIPSCPRPTNLVSLGAYSSHVRLSWSDLSASAWKLRYRERNDDDWIYLSNVLYQRNYTLQGLAPQTDYELQVRGICWVGDTSGWSNSVFFTTACEPISLSDLPYQDDFESYAMGQFQPINPCWFKATNSITPYPYPTSLAASSGGNGLYFYGFHPSDASQDAIYSYAVLPPLSDSLDLSLLTLDFLLKRYDATSFNITTQIQVGLMSNPVDPASFVCLSDIDLFSAASDSVAPVSINFATFPRVANHDPLLANHRFIAFYCPTPRLYGGELCHNYASVDDVNLYLSPLCYPPDSVSFENLTSSSALLSFRPQGIATIVRYRPDFDTNWVVLDTLFGNVDSLLLDSLEHATRYYVQLQSVCNVGAERVASRFSNTYSFATLHGLPYEEDFAAQSIPDGWRLDAASSGSLTGPWVKSTALGNSIKSNIYAAGSFGIISPTIDLAGDTNACLSFLLAVTDFNASSAPGADEPAADDFFHVLISTDGGVHWSDTITWGVGDGYDYDFSLLGNVFTPVAIPLGAYAQGTVTIAFLTESGAMGTDFDVHVARFLAYSPSPCMRPSGSRVDGVSDHGAFLHWDAGSVSQLRYRPYGTSTWSTIDSIAAAPAFRVDYLLSGLLPATTYSVQVRTLCSPDSLSAAPIPSDWVDFPRFTTLCLAESLPYQPLIESAVPDCWQVAEALYLPDSLIELVPSASGWNVSSRLMPQGHFSINIYGASCHYWAVSPLLSFTHPSQISFDAALTAFGTTSRPASVGADDRLLVLATCDNGLTWQTIAAFDSNQVSEHGIQFAQLSNSPRHFEIPIPFPADSSISVRVALYAESSVVNADNDLHIDNILFSRMILPRDTVFVDLPDAQLSGFPLDRPSYTVSGVSDSVDASLSFSMPHALLLLDSVVFVPSVLDAQLLVGGSAVPLLKSSILQLVKSDSAIFVEACMIDTDTLCYHLNFHYTIPFVSVSLSCDSMRGAIFVLDSSLTVDSGSFVARLGDAISLQALPRLGTCYRFVAWEDGDTNSLRQVLLLGDSSLSAAFSATLVYDVDTAFEACNSSFWFDTSYSQSGSYTYRSQPLNGCDSVATLHLTVLYDTYDTIDDVACDSFYWALADTSMGLSGTYDFLLPNSVGCDSLVSLNLTVNYSVVDSVVRTITNAELPYSFNDAVLDSFGVYTFIYATVEGCDSIIVLSLQHSVGVDGAVVPELSVSPNPTSGPLLISHPQFVACELYDLQGRKMLYSREAEIDLSQLPAAIYTLRIVTSHGTYLRKVVKMEP